MKKKAKSLLIVVVFLASLLGVFNNSQAYASQTACGVADFYDPLICGHGKGGNEAALENRVRNVLNTVYLWIGIIAVIVIVIGGVKYMTAAGDSNKIVGAKNAIMYSVIGLVVTLMAFAITNVIIDALDGKAPTTATGGSSSGGGTGGGTGGGDTGGGGTGSGQSGQGSSGGGRPGDGDSQTNPTVRPPLDEKWDVVAVSLSKKSLMMKVGDSDTLSATVNPPNAVDTSLTWASDNEKVAKVDQNGKVTAKGGGRAKISATSRNGVADVAVVTVASPTKPTLKVDDDSILDEHTTTAKVEKNKGSVTWSSSDKSIMMVDSSGKITGKKPGTATLTAKTKNEADESVTLTKKITVREIKILWVGNSKTYVKDIDEKMAAMAKNRGYSVSSTRVSKGGKTLNWNYTNQGTNIKKYYDYVILQEQTDASIQESTFYTGALKIAKAVKAKNSDVKVYVRKAWYLRDSGSSRRAEANKVATSVSTRIASGAKVWSSTTNDGDALYAAKAKGYTVFGDDRHQNNLGAYTAAACIFSKVLKHDPTTITYTPSGFSSSEKNALGTLRQIAKSNCYNK